MSANRPVRREDVLQIQEYLNCGETNMHIAELTGRSRETVQRIRSGKLRPLDVPTREVGLARMALNKTNARRATDSMLARGRCKRCGKEGPLHEFGVCVACAAKGYSFAQRFKLVRRS